MLKAVLAGWRSILEKSHSTVQSNEDWIVINDPNVLFDYKKLSPELRYLIYLRPSRQDKVRELLESGFALGLSTGNDVPMRVRRAVGNISFATQNGLVLPWLENFVLHEEAPVWSKVELDQAGAGGIDLEEELHMVRDYRDNHQNIKIMSKPGRDLSGLDTRVISDMNADLAPLSVHKAWCRLRRFFDPLNLPLGSVIMLCLLVAILSYTTHLFLPVLMFPAGVFLVGLFLLARDSLMKNGLRTVRWKQNKDWLRWLVIISAPLLSLWAYFLLLNQALFLSGLTLGLSLGLFRFYQIVVYLKKVADEHKKLVLAGKIRKYDDSLIRRVIKQERLVVLRIYGLGVGSLLIGLCVLWGQVFLMNGLMIGLLAFLILSISEGISRLEIFWHEYAYRRSLNRLWRKVIVLTSDAW